MNPFSIFGAATKLAPQSPPMLPPAPASTPWSPPIAVRQGNGQMAYIDVARIQADAALDAARTRSEAAKRRNSLERENARRAWEDSSRAREFGERDAGMFGWLLGGTLALVGSAYLGKRRK